MIYLLLSIFFSTLTVSFFKVFQLKEVNTFEAIVFNYISCTLAGSIFGQVNLLDPFILKTPLFPYVVVLGFLFITIFFAISQTAQKVSVSASMVAAKLSVVIPVVMALFLYKETIGVFQWLGIALSMVAVVLISAQGKVSENKQLWLLPLIVFIGSGAIDTLLNLAEQKHIPPFSAAQLVTGIFAMAAVFGLLALVYNTFKNGYLPQRKNIAWGLLLGLPNYFSMFFLVKTLQEFNGSYIFPVNNIGIVAATALSARWFFKEHLNKKAMWGLAIAVLSILLIGLS